MTDTPRDTRPEDPYRRQPPTIDLGAGEYKKTDAAEPPPEGEPQTAIEPMAATGLDETPPAAAAPASPVEAEAAKDPDKAEGSETPAKAADMNPVEVGAAAGARSASVPPISVRPAAEPAAPPHRPVAPEPKPSAPPPPERTRKRGAGSLLLASLLGGAVGAALAIGADLYLKPLSGGGIEDRLAALEGRRPPAAFDPAPLERRVAALEGQTKSLGDGLAAIRSAAESGARRPDDAAARPAAPVAPVAAAPTPPAADTGLRDAVAALEPRIGALEGRVGQAAPASALDEIRTQLAAFGTAQTGAEERGRAVQAALATLQAASGATTQRLAADDRRLGELAAEIAKLPPGQMAAGLRVVVAGQVAEALRGGGPIGPALAALGRLGAPDPGLAALKPFAAQPAPSAAQLAAEFKPLAEKILAEPVGPAASLGDRLLRIADKVVTVRQVGDGSGRDLPGLVGRIESALARGALAEAASTWDMLPDAAKAASRDWSARLKGRVAADDSARRVGAEALAALDAPSR